MATLDASEDPRAQEVCNICLTRLSRYTCPRCNVRYCSLACYRHKKHLQCSESFYRDSVIAELQQMKGSGEERRQVMETLMRMQKGEVEDFDDQTEDHAETLEARVAGLDLDKDLDLVWQRLTPSEQQQFNQLVQSGQLGHLFPPYSPWWEVFTSVVEEEQPSPQKPSVLSCLPPLNSLISDSKVSPCISYNILNVLYAYAYTVRLYNGDHMELAVQASQAVLDISGTLSSNALFYTTRDALRLAVTTVQQRKDLFTSFESSISVMRDVAHILCHPRSHACQVQEALSDLHRLLSAAKVAAKADGAVEPTDVQGLLKQLHRVAKKVFFFVVWSNVHAEELASMSDAVCLESETSLKELQAYEEIEQKVKAVRLPASSSCCHTAPQPLIELLN